MCLFAVILNTRETPGPWNTADEFKDKISVLACTLKQAHFSYSTCSEQLIHTRSYSKSNFVTIASDLKSVHDPTKGGDIRLNSTRV